MKKEKNGPRFLRWPWNVLIYILLVVVLRIFSVPFILLLVWIQGKYNPHGREEGYCLSRTRKRLSWLLWAFLFLLLGAALNVVFLMAVTEERTGWKAEDYVKLAVSGAGAAAMFALGFYTGYVALRDTFFPAKSSLADSIRKQLPYPEEAPPVEQLFAMVDRDLEENGRWFGPVGIGREWVLGDLANRIDRIRGIFAVDEIRRHHTQSGSSTSRVLELVLIDDRWRRNVTDFRNPGDLQAAAEYLALRVPEAGRGRKRECDEFWQMDDIRRQNFEREFRSRQSIRLSEEAQREAAEGISQDMILQAGREVTSRVTPSLVEERLRRCLEERTGEFTLTAARPVESGGELFRSLNVTVKGESVLLIFVPADVSGGGNTGPARETDRRRAGEILEGWLRRQVPDVTDWVRKPVRNADSGRRIRQTAPPKGRLALVLSGGAAESHVNFTEEDIRVAAEGLTDGSYQLVELILPRSMWIRVMAGKQPDGLCIVEAAGPDADSRYFFTARMAPKEAAAWLTGYPYGRFLPGEGKGWKKRELKKGV